MISKNTIYDELKLNLDFVLKEEYIGEKKKQKISLMLFETITNSKLINVTIMDWLERNASSDIYEIEKLLDDGNINFFSHIKHTNNESFIKELISGSIGIIIDDLKIGYTFKAVDFPKRAIEMPTSESAFKSSRDSFNETINSNIGLIREKIKSPSLIVEQKVVGSISQTRLGIVYIKDKVDKTVLEELKKRIDLFDKEAVTSLAVIEEILLSDNKSAFPNFNYTERLDFFTSSIISGTVGLIVDNFPICYIVPATMFDLMKSQTDFSNQTTITNMFRGIRFFAAYLGLLLPSTIAIMMYNIEFVPAKLTEHILEIKEKLPYNYYMEMFIILLAFELLEKASLRTNKSIGQLVPIVGGLIVGDAALKANLISPLVLIIISFSTVSLYTLPNYELRNALKLWRYLFLIGTYALSFPGFAIVLIIFIYNLSTIESFSQTYLYPFVDSDRKFLDIIFRKDLKHEE